MRSVLAFLALAALACQISARNYMAPLIEKGIINLFSNCDLIEKDRHHRNIDPKKLHFHWYNMRVNKTNTFNLEEAAKVFRKEYDFKNNDPIYLHAPGFSANPRSPAVIIVRDGITKLKNVNYILLDASFYIKHDDEFLADSFLKATSNAYGCGQVLGDVLAKFIKDGLPLEKLHVFGHSLGAHLVGYAAQRVYDISGKKLKRISGIDPSLLCFDDMEIVDQISSDDAEYVDIYHSNMGVSGTTHSLGTANFFINDGGAHQPSCIDIPYLSQDCSHVYNSLNFWVDSALHPKRFIAQKCDSYEHWKKGKCKDMPKAQAGLFSVPCKGDYYIKYEFNYISHVIDLLMS